MPPVIGSRETVWVRDDRSIHRHCHRFWLTNGRVCDFRTFEEGRASLFRAGICILGCRS